MNRNVVVDEDDDDMVLMVFGGEILLLTQIDRSIFIYNRGYRSSDYQAIKSCQS